VETATIIVAILSLGDHISPINTLEIIRLTVNVTHDVTSVLQE
jgi:hypothetical protein